MNGSLQGSQPGTQGRLKNRHHSDPSLNEPLLHLYLQRDKSLQNSGHADRNDH